MLEHHHVKPGAGEVDRTDQAGGPGSDHGNTLIADHRAAPLPESECLNLKCA